LAAHTRRLSYGSSICLAFILHLLCGNRLALKQSNAETQSYLVEVVSGIQTVKAQNIELSSRWQWQERYARYVSAGFKTVLTSTTASSISNFLNKLSGLLLLWVGAFLVLKGQLTLGQLIAFRIAGVHHQPSVTLDSTLAKPKPPYPERLSDILDTPRKLNKPVEIISPCPLFKGQ